MAGLGEWGGAEGAPFTDFKFPEPEETEGCTGLVCLGWVYLIKEGELLKYRGDSPRITY